MGSGGEEENGWKARAEPPLYARRRAAVSESWSLGNWEGRRRVEDMWHIRPRQPEDLPEQMIPSFPNLEWKGFLAYRNQAVKRILFTALLLFNKH